MSSYIQQGSHSYWRAITALFMGSFVTFAILYCTQPLIPVFSQDFNTSPAIASLSVSLATASLAVFMIAVSWISDAVGRKAIMAAALLSSAALTVMVAYSGNFEVLLFIRVLQGALLGGFPAIAMAYINEEFNPECSGAAMGIYVSGTAIGGLLGRVIVGALTDLFSWHTALAVIGFISFAVSIWFWFNLPESRNFSPQKRSVRAVAGVLVRSIKQPLLLSLYVIGFLVMGSFVALFNYIGYVVMAPPYNLSHTVTGLIFVVYLVGTFSAALMGKLSDSMGKAKVLCMAISIMLVGCLVTLHMNLFIKLLGVAVFTFGFFGSHSVASSWVGKSAVIDKAQASSLYLMFYYLGSSTIGAVGGEFLKWHGWGGVVELISCALTAALCIGMMLYIPRRETCSRKSM